MSESRAQSTSSQVLLEAEQFANKGGWDIDQQSMDVMGSPYLLAHGLGVPVKDAVTSVTFPADASYRVWVRTRDWVAPWKAPGSPGKYQIGINGKMLDATFGTEGAEWHWQDGGVIHIAGKTEVTLHDLTGFEGRCDAVFFTSDINFTPPNDLAALTAFRRKALGLPSEPDDGGTYDLIVAGGGIAGTSAAISAARNGLQVALVQDRPVLGGNGSSEVRVWPEGHTRQKPYPKVGEIVEELLDKKTSSSGNAKAADVYHDERKLELVRAEPRITLLTEQRVIAAETKDGAIISITAQHTNTARQIRLRGKFFADCTGDGTLGFLAGADYEISKEEHQGLSNLWNVMDVADPKQVLKCECKDKSALGMAALEGNVAAPFPRCTWAIDMSDKAFPGRKNFKGQWGSKKPLDNLGNWFWESGFDKDPIQNVEQIRDLNLRAMYGAWDTLKNVDHLYPNHRIGWAAYIAGKRESRRLLGDVILTVDDFRKNHKFPDGVFPCSWHIDVHAPDPAFQNGNEGNEFISRATEGGDYKYQGPYWAPYRCLYSRNISNLFMAGRDISVTRMALGPVRVMRTTGMMGEIVGKAAWICVRHNETPRGVYQKHLSLLQELMNIDGAARRDSLMGEFTLKEIPNDGYDFSEMTQPVSMNEGKFSSPDFNIWCGSAVKGDDGKYHLYYSRWPSKLGHAAWVTHSEIAHAVSYSALGPWQHHDVALPARGAEFWDGPCTHNPTVLHIGKKYYIYYMGNRGDGQVKIPLNWQHRNAQRIGVAVADSPNGPWQRFDQPLIDVSKDKNAADSLAVNNPSVTLQKDGGVLMIYKGIGQKNPLPFGGPVVHLVATAKNPLGPFTKHEGEIFSAKGVSFSAEDPFIWRANDRYWAIVKDNAGNFTKQGYSLALWKSENGFDWKLANHPFVANPSSIVWKKGTEAITALERPQLLFENGEPIAFYCAAANNKKRDGSFNISIPLKKKSVR